MLFHAIKIKEWQNAKLDAAYVVAFGTLIGMQGFFYLYPGFAAPQPWKPSNLLYFFRFPFALLFVVFGLLFYISVVEWRRKKGKQARR